nr:PTS sugar transporter subunit IIB [Clostridia bacterium]
MKIMLACAAGMSTSMLVEKMKLAAKELNEEHTIWAVSVEGVGSQVDNCDCILLGPQVRLQKNNILKIAKNVPVEVINPSDYGRQNGMAVLEFAKKLVTEKGE